MWDRLLTDCHVATMVASPGNPCGVMTNAAIGIADGRIVRVGKRTELAGFRAREVVALGGAWVTPGLVDCHTHLVFGGTRANEHALRRAGATYEQIAQAGGGIASTVAATKAASADELRGTARRRLQALMAGGVTTIEIKSGYGLDLPTELRLLEVAHVLLHVLAVPAQVEDHVLARSTKLSAQLFQRQALLSRVALGEPVVRAYHERVAVGVRKEHRGPVPRNQISRRRDGARGDRRPGRTRDVVTTHAVQVRMFPSLMPEGTGGNPATPFTDDRRVGYPHGGCQPGIEIDLQRLCRCQLMANVAVGRRGRNSGVGAVAGEANRVTVGRGFERALL